MTRARSARGHVDRGQDSHVRLGAEEGANLLPHGNRPAGSEPSHELIRAVEDRLAVGVLVPAGRAADW